MSNSDYSPVNFAGGKIPLIRPASRLAIAETAIWSDSSSPVVLPSRKRLPSMPVIEMNLDSHFEGELDHLVGTQYGRYQYFHLRLTRPEDSELDYIKSIAPEHCHELLISELEIGSKRLNPHVHIFVHLKERKTLSWVDSLFIKSARPVGTRCRQQPADYYAGVSKHYFDNSLSVENCRCYVTKNGINWSHISSTAKFSRENVLQSVVATLDNVADNPESWLTLPKHVRTMKAKQLLGLPSDLVLPNIVLYERVHRELGELEGKCLFPELYQRNEAINVRKQYPALGNVRFCDGADVECWWVTGEPGTGKTGFMDMLYPLHYKKDKGTMYWESFNYVDQGVENPHQCVVFNEMDSLTDMTSFSSNKNSFDTIKNILDVYPFPIEIKHKAQQMVRPRRVIITSNTTIDNIMSIAELKSRPYHFSNDLFGLNISALDGAIKRRVKVIDIKELKETYNVFTFRRFPQLEFGGVFHCDFKDEIRREVLTIALDDDMSPADRILASKQLKKKYDELTIEKLKVWRYVPYEVVKASAIPIDIIALDKMLETL